MITPPDTLPYRHVLTLPTTGQAVRVTRETAEQVLAEWGVGSQDPCRDPALLIVSEL
ncbi:ATP-binding protein, partial [Streptomyces sp. SID5466]|nr:ATP-binding protein [Streptomyces sp. SID5466]